MRLALFFFFCWLGTLSANDVEAEQREIELQRDAAKGKVVFLEAQMVQIQERMRLRQEAGMKAQAASERAIRQIARVRDTKPHDEAAQVAALQTQVDTAEAEVKATWKEA